MTEDELLDCRFEQLYRADYSARYHRRRATFLSNLDILLTLITALAGASAFADLVSGSPGWLAKIGAAAVTLISLSQVLLRPGYHGQCHVHWLKRWSAMSSDIRLKPMPTAEDVARWIRESATIEEECIGELRALRIDCENISSRVLRLPGRQCGIKPLQRFLIHFGTFQRDFPVIPEQEPPTRPEQLHSTTEAANAAE